MVKINKSIPQKPGVYMFRSKRGNPIYIGKAANLRARLRSYGTGRSDPHVGMRSPKVIALVQEASALSWEILDSEIEALIREAELIKKYRPKYNVLMRDDKQYLYVGFTREEFPKVFVTHQPLTSPNPSFVSLPANWQAGRGKKKDVLNLVTNHYKLVTTHYIGPFTDAGALRTVLKSLRRIFPYCTCKQQHKTLCLNARIGRCIGFCCSRNQNQKSKIKNQNKDCYQRSIYSIKQILLGRNKTLLTALKKQMRTLSEEQRYEEAARVRNQIQALERVFAHKTVLKNDLPSERQKALRALEQLLHKKISEHIHRIEGYDISNIHGKYAYGSMVVFINGMPQKNEYRIFRIWTSDVPMDVRRPWHPKTASNDPAMIHEVISRRLQHREWPLPDVMLIDGGKAQLSAAKAALADLCGLNADLRRNIHPQYSSAVTVVTLAKHEEELYLQNHRMPLKLKESSPALFELLTHIRNEAHRFAIRYYRQAHRKSIAR